MGERQPLLDPMGAGIENVIAGQRVLVTGASGFIGSALVDALHRLGALVYVMAETVDFRRPLYGPSPIGDQSEGLLSWRIEKVLKGDLGSADDCRHTIAVAEPHFVFHLGALTQVTEAAQIPVEAFRVNALGTVNLLDACRRIMPTSQIIVASSDKAYGRPKAATDLPFKPDHILNPVHPYDLSKAAADMAARAMALHYALQLQVTRMANVYGPGDTNWKRLIPGLIRDVIEGRRRPVIRSDGSLIREYLYIDDAVDGYLRLAHAMVHKRRVVQNAQAWNFGPKWSYTVMDVWHEIAEVLTEAGYEPPDPIILNQAGDETAALRIDSSKTNEALDWVARTSLREGIERTHPFIESYLEGSRVGL